MKKVAILILAFISVFSLFAEEVKPEPRVRVVRVPINSATDSSSIQQNREAVFSSNDDSMDATDADENKASSSSVGVVKIEDSIEDVIVRTNSGGVLVSREEARQNSSVKLYWSLGLDLLLPVKKEWKDDRQKAISLGPDATIGMLIKNIGFMSLSLIPTFVQYDSRVVNGEGYDIKHEKMFYESTNLELNLGANFLLGEIDTLIGFAAGVDADTFKNFYIMPNGRFGYKVLGALKPVLDTVNVTVGGKYSISTKVWEIKIGVTFSGLY